MAAKTKWRTRRGLAVIIFTMTIHICSGYEETYTISQLSPKSTSLPHIRQDLILETSETGDLLRIDPSRKTLEVEVEDVGSSEVDEHHYVVARSAEPHVRESRSINIDEIPQSNNEIDNELEMHNKRKYYDIHPTKTITFYRSNDDEIVLSSEGFGDRLNFKFPGEAQRVPKPRALPVSGPKIHPTAVQPMFATTQPRDEGRQNSDIQNIITGIVKLLNGNVNVQANTQLLNGRPRPMSSRINNRGPPRISDLPPLPEYEQGLTPPPPHIFMPTKTPPPYPFDRPPLHVNLPEQIVPPLNRPGFHRPIPPWQRRPRPPTRRPNPGLPVYKPTVPPFDLPERPEEVPSDYDTTHEYILHTEDLPLLMLTEMNTTTDDNDDENENIKDSSEDILPETTSSSTTTITSSSSNTEATSTSTTEAITTSTTEAITTSTTEAITTSTTEKTTTSTTEGTTTPTTDTTPSTTTTEKQTTKTETTMSTTEKSTEPTTSTMETPKTEKPAKSGMDKIKKETLLNSDKEKQKVRQEEKISKVKNDSLVFHFIESSISETKTTSTFSIATPTPTEGLVDHVSTSMESSTSIETSSINSLPLPTSQGIPYHPYRPRPGIVLDDTEFKPKGSRHRERVEASVITAAHTALPSYGEIFDVTVSAIQGPGEKGGSVHIQNINLSGHGNHDDIIVSPSGDQGFVSIDGKRKYLNLFDTTTTGENDGPHSIKPTRVHTMPHSVAPLAAPPLDRTLGTGEAIPADEVSPNNPSPHNTANPPAPPRKPPHHQHARPQQVYRRPQPTVRIDTCIVGDDSTCDQAQNEKCRTEAGISSCQCRPGYARRVHRDPCRRVVAFLMNLRVDRLYDKQIAWSPKLADKESDPYHQLSYEAVRAIDSAFSMTPFSDDFVSGSVNSIHKGDNNQQGVFVNFTILMQETPESLRSAVATDIQKHILGVIRRRSNNIGTSALWVDSPHGSVLPLKDVDECMSSDLNDCHQLATCTNTWGGFKCACPDTTLDPAPKSIKSGRECRSCASSHCNERGECHYNNGQPYCRCTSGYYGSTCEVDGEVVGVAVGASLAAALVIALTLAALMSWSRKWSREQKAIGMGSPVFNYMAANTVKTPPVGQPPYQVTLEERMRWAQIAEAMAQANHYNPEAAQAMATRPSSALFSGYPTLPPVPLPRMGIHGSIHNGTLNTVASRANTAASHHNLYGYTNHMVSESTSSEASSHVQDRADLLVPRPKSRARSMHNQTGIYYDVDYENAPEAVYGTKGIPLSTYTVSRGPPFYRS